MDGKKYTLSFLLNFLLVGLTLAKSGERVAVCRARCLDKFYPHDSPSDAQCKGISDCFMCWDICQLLDENYDVWGNMCTDSIICFPGCQQACAFHTDSIQRKERAVSKEPIGHFPTPIRVQAVSNRGVVISWSKPQDSSSTPFASKLVYVVLGRIRSGSQWQEIVQTTEMMAAVDDVVPGKKFHFRVVAVSGTGVFASAETTYAPNFAVPQDDDANKNDFRQVVSKSWELTASVQYSSSLESVDVIFSWTPPQIGEYVIVWQVVDGGVLDPVKGHLYTDVTLVSLPLQRASMYRVHVEMRNNELKSEQINVNTGRAGITYIPIIATRDSVCTMKSILILIGVAAAMTIFVAVAGIFIFRLRWRSQATGEDFKESSAVRSYSLKRRPIPPLEIQDDVVERGMARSSPKRDGKLRDVHAFMESLEKMSQTLSPVCPAAVFLDEGSRVSPPPYELHDSAPPTPHRSVGDNVSFVSDNTNESSEQKRSQSKSVFNFDHQK